jgi:hypothetical protein
MSRWKNLASSLYVYVLSLHCVERLFSVLMYWTVTDFGYVGVFRDDRPDLVQVVPYEFQALIIW